MNMKDIAIYGAGGFGREIAYMIKQINEKFNEWNFVGFFDDGKCKGETINDSLILGGIQELNLWNKELAVIIAIGTPNTKETIHKQIINKKIDYPTLIHPSVIAGDMNNVHIGKGCLICAGTIITTNIEIKDFVTLNLLCTVGHDTIIEAYSSFMPSVNISGEVVIHTGVYVGTGAKIINQLTIGERTIIGAGAVVASDIPAHCTAVGVPARLIKYHDTNN